MHIAILLVLALLATVSAADTTDVEDLGTITENVGIALEPATNRPDVQHFLIEILPQQWPTNKVVITTTNRVLMLEHLTAVPHGTNLMAVRTIASDNSESPIKLFRFDLRRDTPNVPSAHRIWIARHKTTNSLEHYFHSRRQALTNSLETPPIPGQTNKPAALRGSPLPNGTPKTYSDHIDDMRKFYASHSEGQRRNQ
jgi:hypothetical protein